MVATSTMSELDQEFGAALNDVWRLVAQRRPYEELVAAFKAVECEFVPRLEAAGEHWEAQETRRRVAEGLLGIAIDAGRSVEEYDQILQQIRELGFDDIRREIEVSLTYAHGCARHGAHERVLHCLIPLVERLAADAEPTDSTVRQLIGECHSLIHQSRSTP